MLENLEIQNGIMSPKFDVYNNTYTVNIKNDVDYLIINYDKTDDVSIEITGNEYLKEGENEVFINVVSAQMTYIIKLIVNKEATESVSSFSNLYTDLQTSKQVVTPFYLAPLIGSICFILIIILFAILFSKKHKI